MGLQMVSSAEEASEMMGRVWESVLGEEKYLAELRERMAEIEAIERMAKMEARERQLELVKAADARLRVIRKEKLAQYHADEKAMGEARARNRVITEAEVRERALLHAKIDALDKEYAETLKREFQAWRRHGVS
ncbi:hypothetical protein QJS04_geneDACA005280 [Acorus gramineus]|uniref:Uncharacterized protein n=1 Tax=Acorus gramineus TaxID=55184 RepID=A0AAV9AZD6_ACOGR|nr:hypothetical protein QJS04_geneDACA005280 [Acorus gramineus]